MAKADDDCMTIKHGFYRARNVESLLLLPFGIKKSPSKITQGDYEAIGRRVQECIPTASVGSIRAKITDIMRETDEARKSAERSLNDLISFFLERGIKLRPFQLDLVKKIEAEHPELHARVQQIFDRQKLLEAARDRDEKARADELAKIQDDQDKQRTRKEVAEASYQSFISRMTSRDGPADCVAMKQAMDEIKDHDPSKDAQHANQLLMAGERGDACEIVDHVKERFEEVRKKAVACSRAVAKGDDPLANKASSNFLGQAALVRFLSEQTLRGLLQECGN